MATVESMKRVLPGPAAARAVGVELVIVAIAAATYVIVREVTEGSPARALANARELIAVERALGLHHERWVQSLILEREWLRTAVNWMYIWGHWPVIIAASVSLWWLRHDIYVRLRNAIFVSGLLGFLLFALVPMAPPRLTDLGYVDSVTVWSNSYRVLQPPHYTNLYAAMPSLHFGWDLLVGIAIFASSTSWILRGIGIALPMAMAFAVVATGNHWILDVVVALVVVGVGALIAEVARVQLEHRRTSKQQAAQPASAAGARPGQQHGGRPVPAREPAR